MNYTVELENIASNNGGIITVEKAKSFGITRDKLSKLNSKGIIERITNGQYIIINELYDELYSISLRSNNIILSHESALYLYGLFDRIPFQKTFTYPVGNAPSLEIKKITKLYSIKKELFELGKTTIITQYGSKIPCYDLERTFCDLIRSRNKIGEESFRYALHAYVNSKNKNLNRLYEYSKIMNIENIVRKYIEVLL